METGKQDIQLDFGAGKVQVLPFRCLRIAKEPTDCTICAEACPVSAIALKNLVLQSEETQIVEKAEVETSTAQEKRMGVAIGEECIQCGLCATLCPMESLSTAGYHHKSFERVVTKKAEMLEGLSIGCTRALSDVPDYLSTKVIPLPCLAAIDAETWLFTATMAEKALFSADEENSSKEACSLAKLKVYLPPSICDECPVNNCGVAEGSYLEAITQAEEWGAGNIELVVNAEELDSHQVDRLLHTLEAVASGGKRESAEHFVDALRQIWNRADENRSADKRKTEFLADLRESKKPRKIINQNQPRPFGKKSQKRKLLRHVLEMKGQLVPNIALLCATTVAKDCIGCGNCVNACSLGARKLVASTAKPYFDGLAEEERPQGEKAAVTDRFSCLGCDACVPTCPTGACTLEYLTGDEFMRLRQV